MPIGPDIEPTPRAPTGVPARVANPMLGAASMTMAALLFAGLNGLVRYAADLGYHPFQIGFLRSIFALIVMLPVIAPVLRREGAGWLRTSRPGLYLFRGLAATVGVLMWMTALATMPMAEATAISFTAPLFATAGSALILKETVRLRRWSAILIGFVGVLVILRPGLIAPEPGAFAALGAAVGMASAALLIKALTRTEPAQRIVLYTSLVLSVTTAIPAALVWVPMTPAMWGIGIAMGIIGAISHMFLTKAFEMADASVVLPFDYARLPFAAAVGWLFFAQTSDAVTWAGALIIAGSALYVARREQVMTRRQR